MWNVKAVSEKSKTSAPFLDKNWPEKKFFFPGKIYHNEPLNCKVHGQLAVKI